MITIEHLSGGRWRLIVPTEGISPAQNYSERIVFGGYVAQTAYWGEAQVWKIKDFAPFEEKDSSC